MNNFTEIIDKFNNWINQKIKLNQSTQAPRTTKEGQIWWVSLGQNIGSESYGKGKTFTRPVIIYRKLSKELLRIVPLSTQLKTGSWFVRFSHNNQLQTAILSQIRVIDHRRLENYYGQIDDQDYQKIKLRFLDLYG